MNYSMFRKLHNFSSLKAISSSFGDKYFFSIISSLLTAFKFNIPDDILILGEQIYIYALMQPVVHVDMKAQHYKVLM